MYRVTITCSIQWSQPLGSYCFPSLSTQHQFFHRCQLSCMVFGIIFIILRAHEKLHGFNFSLNYLFLSIYMGWYPWLCITKTSIVYGLTRPSLGQCDFMCCLKLFFTCLELTRIKIVIVIIIIIIIDGKSKMNTKTDQQRDKQLKHVKQSHEQ